MNFTTTLLPIIAALTTGQEFLKIPHWHPINPHQETFLKFYYRHPDQLSQLSQKELESRLSLDVQEINQFLKNRHFDIQLEHEPEGSVYVASVLDIVVQWIEKGEKISVTANEQSYPAVALKKNYTIFWSSAHNHEVIEIKTKSDDVVYMTIGDQPLENFDLLEKIRRILHDRYLIITHDFSSIIFPMVDLNHEVDISWLCGMQAIGTDPKTGLETPYEIAQALQQTKFQMNEEGAAAQSAAAIAITRTAFQAPKPPLIIDKPFYLWIMRKGISIPLFAGSIDHADWKEPAKLGF